ncbi:hypothetical protein AJ88_15565 [Mesorhizobium amorphae CCBAU 01583]|nr:hypothetical protein AJ88_15565 [Mesorhizobium amorphae CCBAU 01583]
MLPQILRQPAAVEIAKAAAAWYALHHEEANARFEALYYRGLAGDELPEAERSTLRQLANVLGADVDDLPTKLRARVKNAAGQRRLTEPEVAALPAPERAKIMAQRRRAQIAVGLESVVVADDKLEATARLKFGALESAAAKPATPESIVAESDAALESTIPADNHQAGPLASPKSSRRNSIWAISRASRRKPTGSFSQLSTNSAPRSSSGSSNSTIPSICRRWPAVSVSR